MRSNRLFDESVLAAAGEVARLGHDRVWSLLLLTWPLKLSSVAIWVRSNRLFDTLMLAAADEVARHGHDRVWSQLLFQLTIRTEQCRNLGAFKSAVW